MRIDCFVKESFPRIDSLDELDSLFRLGERVDELL